jgi:membrane protein
MSPSANPARLVARLRAGASDRWRNLKAQRPGIAHAVSGYRHYKDNHGDHLAAAITYFSFLALFPLVLLGVSITGFVLASHMALQRQLFTDIARNVPGGFGDTLTSAINSAVQHRTSVGVVGLVGVVLAGLGWIANLRTAIDTVWGLPEAKRSFVVGKISDALVLLGLGAGVVISLGLTAGGTAASGAVLNFLGWSHVSGAGVLATVLGIVLGILGSVVIFGWLLIRLPQVHVARRTAVRTTLLAAVGFEVLKLIGTYYIARVTASPAAAVIGPVVGILVWIDLVSRYLLYCVAWASTAEVPAAPSGVSPSRVEVSCAEGSDGVEADGQRAPKPTVSPVGVAFGLLSAGAALGGASVALLQRRRARGRLRSQR